MSFPLLEASGRSPAFDPTPPPMSLAEAHVKYSVLTGDDIEGEVAKELAGFGRVALVGPTGSGKSSLARYVLKPNGHALAPIWINVATEDHALIGTVRGFLEVLTSQLVRKAQRVGALNDKARREVLRRIQGSEPLGVDEAQLQTQLGGSFWLLKGGLAAEISRTFDHGEAYRPTEDLRDGVREVLAALREHELTPVLVADDTDRLLRVGANPEVSESLFLGFFGEVLREITDQMECGLIVATHDRYVERHDYKELTDGRLRSLSLPILDEPAHFGSLITARVEFIERHASWRDLVEPEAVERLSDLHTQSDQRSIRRTLATLREALVFAAAEGAELCAARHVDGAAAAQGVE